LKNSFGKFHLERGKVRIERKLREKKGDPRGERGRTRLKIKVEGKIGARKA